MAGPAQGRRKLARTLSGAVIVTAAITATVAAAVWPADGSPTASARPRDGSAASTARTRAEPSVRVPAGWAPVPFRRAQLSVPGPWLVQTPGETACWFRPTGMIFAGTKPVIPKGAGCRLTASYAWIIPAGHIPAGLSHRKPTAVINGIPVYRRPSAPKSVLYLVPALGVRVGAHGRLARRVLATLTRSPLAVVLAKGPAGSVPAHWAWHRFGGVRFAVPRAWRRDHQNRWATCDTGLIPGSLLLINATKPPFAIPCPYTPPFADQLTAQPGLTAVTGKFAAESVAEQFTRCHVRHGTRLCLAAVTGQGGDFGGVLIFSVSRPHHHPAAFFVLGLSGSGARARAIFDSMTLR